MAVISINLSITTRNWAAVNPALRKTEDIAAIKLFETKLARVTLCKTNFAEINTKPAAGLATVVATEVVSAIAGTAYAGVVISPRQPGIRAATHSKTSKFIPKAMNI